MFVQRVRALADPRILEDRKASGRQDSSALTAPEDFSEALAPFFESFEELRFDHQARLSEHTQISELGDNRWQLIQILLDPEDENLWYFEGEVDLSDEASIEGPLIAVKRIGT